MATQRETVDFIIEKFRDPKRFAARAMFGEYALYADGKVVALVCDDQVYVKIVPASAALAGVCEQGTPYPGAKPHYLVEEEQLSQIDGLSGILFDIAATQPEKKVKKKASAK